jgi:hypothetical protein
MSPEKIVKGFSNEIGASLKAMAKAETPEEKHQYSEIIRNLTESLSTFRMSQADPYEDGGPIPF